jgi:hypothetical protein
MDPQMDKLYRVPVHPHTPNNRPKTPGHQQLVNQRNYLKDPGQQQPLKPKLSLNQIRPNKHAPDPQKGTHHRQPVKPKPFLNQIRPNKPNLPSPQKGTYYQEPVKPNAPAKQTQPNNHNAAPGPQKGTVYQQPMKPNTPINHARPKSLGSHQQPAVNPTHNKDPTKDPTNKTMFNKRPRVATSIKDFRLQKAHDEAKALASEIRKMD